MGIFLDVVLFMCSKIVADNWQEMSLVMYLVLRRDLTTALKWPVGAVITQAAHAATACMWEFREDPVMKEYTKDIDHMHKVTLGVDGADELLALQTRLRDAGVDHRLWVEDEQPVAIALKPAPRATLKNLLRDYKLF